jgi:tubulin-specific chaperone A
MMIPDCQRRLLKAFEELKQFIESEQDLKENEEFIEGEHVLKESETHLLKGGLNF